MLRKCKQFVEETMETKENPREPKAAAVQDLRKPPEPLIGVNRDVTLLISTSDMKQPMASITVDCWS